MPRYDYKCKNCNKDFFIICPISDKRENIKCDNCQSLEVIRIYNATILKNKSETNNKLNNSAPDTIKEKHHTHKHVYGSHCCPEDDYI